MELMERFLKLYEFIAPILLKNPKSPTMIDASELEVIKEVLTVLSPIEAASKEMCGENYLTSSKVIPLVNCLIKRIETSSPSTEEVLALKTITLNEIHKRFGAIEQNKLLAVATILDPRFKKLHFNTPVACANDISFINQSILLHEQQIIDTPPQHQSAVSTNPNSVWAYHEELATKCTEKKR